MDGPTAPPPTSSNSSAPAFKSNPSGSPSHATAQGVAPAAAAAAPASPPTVNIPSDAVVAVLGVVGELRHRGLLAGLEVPEAELTDARAPALFDGVLAAFLDEAWGPGAVASLPIPPPAFGDGRSVELLRLFLSVRARGGSAAVDSWAAVAVEVGLDPAADVAVKLLHGKYLGLLEQRIGKPLDGHVASSGGNAGRRFGSKKGKYLSPAKAGRSVGSPHLKRKREELVEMLDWVRLTAESPAEPEVLWRNSRGQFSAAVRLRRQMFAKNASASYSSEVLEGMLDWVRLVAKSPAERGIVVGGNPRRHLSTAVQLRRQMFAGPGSNTRRHSDLQKSRLSNEGGVWPAPRSTDSILAAPSRQAEIPEWTGKPASYDDDPEALKFLGQPILIPGSNADTDGSSAGGEGRRDGGCSSCKFPGSMACVRFHVAEKRLALRRELGPAFYEMGFDRVGEDVALAWTREEERRFDATVQQNLPATKRNFWNKLQAVFRDKGREGLASYYHNVFQVWRRAYQNRLAPNADAGEDSIEPGFLYIRLSGAGGDQGSGSSRSGGPATRLRRNS